MTSPPALRTPTTINPPPPQQQPHRPHSGHGLVPPRLDPAARSTSDSQLPVFQSPPLPLPPPPPAAYYRTNSPSPFHAANAASSSASQPRFFQTGAAATTTPTTTTDADELPHIVHLSPSPLPRFNKPLPQYASPPPQSAPPPPYHKESPKFLLQQQQQQQANFHSPPPALHRAVSLDCFPSSAASSPFSHNHNTPVLPSPPPPLLRPPPTLPLPRLSFDSLSGLASSPVSRMASPAAASARSSLLQLTPSAKKQQAMMLEQIHTLQLELVHERQQAAELGRRLGDLHAQRFTLAVTLAFVCPGLCCVVLHQWWAWRRMRPEGDVDDAEAEEDDDVYGDAREWAMVAALVVGVVLALAGAVALWRRVRGVISKWEDYRRVVGRGRRRSTRSRRRRRSSKEEDDGGGSDLDGHGDSGDKYSSSGDEEETPKQYFATSSIVHTPTTTTSAAVMRRRIHQNEL